MNRVFSGNKLGNRMYMPTKTPTKYCVNVLIHEMFGGETYPVSLPQMKPW